MKTCPPRPRDSRGWAIPREGTTSSLIYNLMLSDNAHAPEISRVLGIKYGVVAVLMWKIRNPDRAAKYRARNYARHMARKARKAATRARYAAEVG